MQLQENDIILYNYRRSSIAPIIKKKDWYERNKESLNLDGWRIPTKQHLKQILDENEIQPFKKERKKKKEENKEE